MQKMANELLFQPPIVFNKNFKLRNGCLNVYYMQWPYIHPQYICSYNDCVDWLYNLIVLKIPFELFLIVICDIGHVICAVCVCFFFWFSFDSLSVFERVLTEMFTKRFLQITTHYNICTAQFSRKEHFIKARDTRLWCNY